MDARLDRVSGRQAIITDAAWTQASDTSGAKHLGLFGRKPPERVVQVTQFLVQPQNLGGVRVQTGKVDALVGGDAINPACGIGRMRIALHRPCARPPA